jgi:hypothetical protein
MLRKFVLLIYGLQSLASGVKCTPLDHTDTDFSVNPAALFSTKLAFSGSVVTTANSNNVTFPSRVSQHVHLRLLDHPVVLQVINSQVLEPVVN